MSFWPHDNCHWMVPGRFLAGGHPGALSESQTHRRLARIVAFGVRHFLDLTETHEGVPYDGLLATLTAPPEDPVGYERHPIPDGSPPLSPTHTREILDQLDQLIGAARVPYLHCWGGAGRTGTIAGCWLVRHGHGGEDALAALARHRAAMGEPFCLRQSPETPAQRAYVLDWARHDRVRPA
ncbi:MAG: hypothetical protein WCJ69_15665 [Betaproteobacteria bacterium]|jgi:hypothetical protein